MGIESIIQAAIEEGVYLFIKNNRLAFRVAKGGMSESLKAQLKQHKLQIEQFLLAAQASEQKHQGLDHQLPPLRPQPPGSPKLLSFSQKRLWFIDQLNQGSSEYNLPVALSLQGQFSINAFETALAQLIDRHQILRTQYISEPDSNEVRQQVSPVNSTLPLRQIDLSEYSKAEQSTMVDQLAEKEARLSFNLAQDLMLRATIIKLADLTHVVLFTMHHIASDGWSMNLLVMEFSACYDAASQSLPNPLEPLTVQYADYAYWQNQWLKGDLLAKGLDYWQNQLTGIAPVHSLPLDFVRPKQQSYEGANYRQQLPAALVAGIDQLSKQQTATQFMLLQTAFALLISRFSQEPNVVMGTPVAGRLDEQLAGLIGFFINNLVLRTDCSSDISFNQLLARNKTTIIDAFEFQFLPFDVLVEHFNPERNLSHDAIFQIVFGLNNNDSTALTLPNLSITELAGKRVGAKVELELAVTPVEDGLVVDWTYNTGIFKAQSIEIMAHSFASLLQSIVENPDAQCSQLAMMGLSQRQQLLQLGQNEPHLSAEPMLFAQRFATAVASDPDQVAVVCGDVTLSYGQLDHISTKLAAYCHDIDIAEGSRVGLYLPRGIAQLVALLGVVKAGASYVPLEPGLPEDRLLFMIADADVELVMLEGALMDTLKLSGTDVLLMDDLLHQQWLGEYDQDITIEPAGSHQEAYVLYTSGSSGRPKGVRISQGGLAHYLAHATSEYMLPHIEGAVVSSPLCFDATITSLLTPLCVGKSVHLLADGDQALEQLPQYLFDIHRHWLFKLTPAHLDALVYSGMQSVGRHCIVIGGEQLHVSTLKQWKGELLPQSCFINEYGPTETVVGTCVYKVQTEQQLQALDDYVSVPVGTPIRAATLFVVGQGEQLQPLNSVGELYIGGPGVSLGYLNLAQQNQTSFGEFAGQRVYRTGDLVRWLPNGELSFIGRRDEQVKIRGYRIELSEIRQQMIALPQIAEAFVRLVNIADKDPILVGYLVAEEQTPQQSSSQQALIELCQRQLKLVLAEYMVPSHFVCLDHLPLTVNGKVDIRALPHPTGTGQKAARYVEPSSPLQQLLCDIWAQVMAVEKVGIEDNFFALGGDSIRSIKVVSLLARENIHTDIKTIFAHQSVAQLSAHLEQHQVAQPQPQSLTKFELLSDAERIRIVEQYGDTIADAYPLSTLQSGMVFHTQLENFSGIYHDVNAEYLQCRWDQALFSTALQLCIDRHPILRTRFDFSAERGIQLVMRQVDLPLQVVDIKHLSHDQQQQHIQAWTRQRQRHVFDWLNGPLFQINIFLRDESRFEFIITFHHSVLDGWSRASFSSELYSYYQQLLAGKPFDALSRDSGEPWIYRQYIAQEQAALNSTAASDYFARMLEDAPMSQIPSLPDEQALEQSQGHYDVPDFLDRGEAIIALAKRLAVPVQVILLTAHLKVLSTVSGQRRVATCVVNNGRPEQAGGESALGLFLNSVPLAMSLFPSTWLQLVEQVKNGYFANLEYRHYPLAVIQKSTGLALSEVLFNYTHFHILSDITDSAQSDNIAVLASSGFEQTNFDFQLDIARQPDGDAMHMSFTYNRAKYGRQQVENMGHYYLNALDQLLGDLTTEHNTPGLLSAPEKAYLLNGIHCMPQQPEPLGDLVSLFEGQVDQNPQAIAISCQQLSLSYGELDARANQLAHYLLAQGVTRDSLVGLSVPRSIEMIIAILAILKAGGAYLPLDPAYPLERLNYMIDNSGLKLLLVMDQTEDQQFGNAETITCIDLRLPTFNQYPQTRPKVSILPQQLAYVIYTSGSTGQPKGVMVEHGNVQRLMSACQADFQFTADDVWCLFHSYAFDFSVWEMWGALAFGGKLVVVPQWLSRSPADFYQLVCEQKVTILNQTPTAFIQFNQMDAEQQQPLSLRAVVFGGEALKLSELQGWLKRHGDDQPMLVNMYGITETTVHVTFRRLLKADIDANQGSLIGRALSDLKVLVLDEQLQPVPLGTSGEMFVGGSGVTRGYLHQAELTASRFIDDPFDTGAKLYRTGDLARYLPSAELEYLGRIDEQVKIRGFRIELGEIEQQLSAQDHLDSCLVLVKEDSNQLKQLVAYIKAVEGSELPSNELIDISRAHLKQNLPVHMIPAVFVVIEQWPLTANGKVDKKALPQPDMTVLQAEYVGPKNERQQLLCDIWQSVLGLEQVGIKDNFFNIGGDSILSIQIVAALKAKGFAASVKQIFEQQTIETLSSVLQSIEPTLAATANAQVQPFAQLSDVERSQFGEAIEDAYPLSNLQAGMVFHTQLAGFNGIYHDIMAEHVKCPWDEACFSRALAASIHRHPILRSGFVLTGHRPLQQVFKQIATPLVVEDLRGMSNHQQQAYLATWTEQRKTHQFDWLNGPLFQINVFLRSDQSFEFVISFHHAILDGWSRAAFSTELYNDYEQLLAGHEIEPAQPEWIYRDFIALETADINNPAIKAHFVDMLGAIPRRQVPHKVDADIQAPRLQQTLVLAPVAQMTPALLNQAKHFGVPIQAILLAVHFKVLSFLSGESTAVSCVTHNGRPEVKGAELGLGLYLNSLPLSVVIDEQQSWQELVSEVAQLSARNMEYRRYPLAEIQKHLDIEFSEVTFNYTHFHIYDSMNDRANSSFELLESRAFEQTNFDFHVDISRALDSESLSMVIHYNGHLFAAEQIERIASYYVMAFEQLLKAPQQNHYSMSLMSKAQLAELENWGIAEALETQPSFPQQFVEQAKKAPQRCAVMCDQTELSYGLLDQLSARLAGYLTEMEIVQGSRVGLFLPRSVAQVVAILGVSKAGASYVPLEPELPVARLEHMIVDSQLELILLPRELMGAVSFKGVDVLLMDDVLSDSWLAEFDYDGVNVEIDHNTEAYLLYTSGSSGRPKGVQITHGGLSHYLAHAKACYINDDIKGAVVSSPLCFDATITSLLTPICVGKRIHLLSDGDKALDELPHWLFEADEPLLFKLTPAHLDALVYSQMDTSQGSQTQHCIVVGGEQLSMATLTQWKQTLLPESRFINEYGPTETVVGTSYQVIDSQESLQRLSHQAAVPIGQPIAGSHLYVVGPGGALQPVNSVGELYIGGAGVSPGYVNLDAQTAAVFVHYNNLPVYKTGDLVRWLPGGELTFVGRADKQVKIRGYRIELDEINQQLLQHECISEAFTTTGPQDRAQNQAAEPRLTAYIVAAKWLQNGLNNADIAQQCHQHLAANLPTYMLPSDFVLLAELPLTTNGKVDVRALPAAQSQMSLEHQYVAPVTELERQLCQVFEQVMEKPQVGVEDNFFSIGGDSIRSIRVVSLLRREGIDIDIKALFDHKTVSGLVKYIESGKAQLSEVTAVTPFSLLTSAEKQYCDKTFGERIEDAYPLSTLQSGMVFHTQLSGFSGIYHDLNAEHLQCPWQQTHFETALRSCIEQYPVLRTGYDLSGERALQLVYRQIELPLVINDIQHLTDEQQRQHIEHWTESHKRLVFDWINGPLCQINIFLRSTNSFEFVISFHHSVLDGWSRASLTTRLYAHYESLLSGKTWQQGRTDWIYREYIALELAAIEHTAAIEHFEQMTRDVNNRQLPQLLGLSGETEKRQESYTLSEFRQRSTALIDLAKSLGKPVSVILLAVHMKVLSVFADKARVTSCIVSHGRPEIEGGDQGIGMFLNSLPMTLDIKSGSWLSLIEAVDQVNRDNVAFRHFPLALIQQKMDIELSEILFNYTHFHVFDQLSALESQQDVQVLASSGFEQTNFDFYVDVSRFADEMQLSFKYDANKYGKTLVERIGQYYIGAADCLIADIEQEHQDALLMSAEEQQLLTQWTQGESTPIVASPLSQLFSTTAARIPKAIACNDLQQRLSYRQLDQQSNQLARLLVEQGVGCDTIVGVSVAPKVELLVILLAILKAGGAYLPLDPAYPADRLDYMVNDSGVQLLICDENLVASYSQVKCLGVASLSQQWPSFTAEPLHQPFNPDSLAYLIYTSGSTGRPKGVAISHRAANNFIVAMNRALQVDSLSQGQSQGRWLLLTSLAFDISLYEWMGALALGKEVLVASQEMANDPFKLKTLLDEYPLELIQSTPSRWRQLLAVNVTLPKRMFALCGGEALDSTLARQLLLADLNLWNCYGPTEATVWSMVKQVNSADLNHAVVPLGRSLANYYHRVLNARGQLLPVGSEGELYIGGSSLAEGYFGQPKLSAERFIVDHTSIDREDKKPLRLYKTGDLVRITPEGNMIYLGRADDQIKLRGHRMELTEIEHLATTLEGIEQAAMVIRGEGETAQLVGFVTLSSSADSQADWPRLLDQHLRQKLPIYMVPANLMVLELLPQTPNGKVDKGALPAIDIRQKQRVYVAPETPLQWQMAELWAQMLKRDTSDISLTDNFFEIGGNSLILVRLLEQITQKFDVKLEFAQLFESRTLAQLTEQVGLACRTKKLSIDDYDELSENEIESVI